MADDLKSVEEVEIAEEDIVGYLVDEEEREIGVIVLDQDGNEVELYYDDEDADVYEAAGEEDSAGEEETIELEIDEDDILYYFVNKAGKEIGFAAKGEDGQKVDYFYPEEDDEAKVDSGSQDAPASSEKPLPIIGDVVSKDELRDMAGTIKDVAMEGYSTIADIMDQVDDMRDSLDAINPKKRRQARRAARNTETFPASSPAPTSAADPAPTVEG